jgi:hypothetical protein
MDTRIIITEPLLFERFSFRFGFVRQEWLSTSKNYLTHCAEVRRKKIFAATCSSSSVLAKPRLMTRSKAASATGFEFPTDGRFEFHGAYSRRKLLSKIEGDPR